MRKSGKSSPIQSILHFLKGLFAPIFSWCLPVEKKRSSMLPPIPPKIADADWSRQDAMVGTVRSKEQLAYNLSQKCYYVPGRFLPRDKLPISYIALHEWDDNDIPCILRVGQVLTTEIVERRTIPVTMRTGSDPTEPYYFFTVKNWESLPHRIEILDTPRGKPLFTRRLLLEHFRVSWPLFSMESPEDYVLLDSIFQLLENPKKETSPCPIGIDRLLILEKDTLILTNKKKEPLGNISTKQFANSPRNSFLYLKKLLS